MKSLRTLTGMAALLSIALTCRAAEPPEMPSPQKQHEWLNQFTGKWNMVSKIQAEPGQPPIEGKGTQTGRTVGGFWLVCEGKSECMGVSAETMLTLGFDTAKQKYVGTWVDSMTGYLWVYEGELDARGNTLTLYTRGPCPMSSEGFSNFKEVIEVQDKDHYTLTSYLQGDDKQWTQIVSMSFTRAE